jgi:hypothetical protein
MSQENVELVRKSMIAFAERDVDALRELNDPEVELDWSASIAHDESPANAGFVVFMGTPRKSSIVDGEEPDEPPARPCVVSDPVSSHKRQKPQRNV